MFFFLSLYVFILQHSLIYIYAKPQNPVSSENTLDEQDAQQVLTLQFCDVHTENI